jgi:ParB-like nuclease domain
MTLRPIKPIPLIGIEPKPISTALPRFGWTDPKTLLVEDEYQRRLTKRSITLIRSIAEDFDWLHIKPPVCARGATGKLCVIDGQHTAIAAASRGLRKIPVMIVEAPEISRRARAFVAHNTNRLNVTPIQLWHSRVAAGDKAAMEAASVCKAAGVVPIKAQPGNGQWQIGDTIAFKTIERLIKRRDRDDSIRVLKTLLSAKRAPVAAHEILAVEAILYDESFGYDGPVFDLVTVIRSKRADGWTHRYTLHRESGAPTHLWRQVAEAWVRALKKKEREDA